MRRTVRCGLWIVLAVISLPTVSAATVQGMLVAETVELPSGASLQGSPIAIFVESAQSMGIIRGALPSATIHLVEQTYVTANILDQRPAVATGSQRPVWTVHDAKFTVTGVSPGWLGVHPRGGSLVEDAPPGGTLVRADQATVGNGVANPDEGNPELPYYLARTTDAVLDRTASHWKYTGSGLIKMMGPRITIQSLENETTIQTGEEADPQNPAQTVRRWLTIEFNEGVIVASEADTRIISRSATAAWDGTATLDRATGTLAGTFQTWAADGRRETLEGNLSASLTVDEIDRIALFVAGDLRSSTLAKSVSAPIGPSSSPLSGAILLVALVLGGAGTVFYVTRRTSIARTSDDLGAEELVQLADSAADREDYEAAAKWAALGRVRSPTSKRLALDHAFYVAQTGERMLAIHMLLDPIVKDDADARLLLARLYLQERELDAAAGSLAEALKLAPIMLLDIETDPAFDELRSHPAAKRALGRARRKLE